MRKKIRFSFLIIIGILVICTNVKAVDSNMFSMTNATGAKDDEITIYISLNLH